MVSRLDRLFILLDTGSNESTRLAAAKQLGEVQRVQPNDLDYLLQRIKEYSGKSVWETRVAAGQATRHVLENVEPWQLIDTAQSDPDSKEQCKKEIADKIILDGVNPSAVLEQFDIEKIMSLCPKLLSLDLTEGDESELASPSGSKSSSRLKSCSESTSKRQAKKQDKEQLMRQRKLINKELGIGMVDSLNLGVKSTDIVSNDDLQTEYESTDALNKNVKSTSINQDARVILHQHVLNYEKVLLRLDQIQSDSTSHSTRQAKDSVLWPLSKITQSYAEDLFNPSWEIRHGAAICLREIVRSHGKSAGRRADLSAKSNETLNQLWLVDMAIKALCVLALDKFGDFLFDQVVAPVRENAAQLLGCCVMSMSESNATVTINLLVKMLQQSNWETRHGGVLGLKYCLNAVNETLAKKILTICFDPIFRSLADTVDDVSAEAAAALVPVKDLMIETIPKQTPKLIKFLWEHLANLDELTSSTSNIVLLLASLVTSSSADLQPIELTKSIPRLWSLLNHSSTSVRISVLKALTTLLESQKSPCIEWMPIELHTTALRLMYQRSILENMDEVRLHIENVWKLLIRIENDKPASKEHRLNLLRSTSVYLNHWLCLAMQPPTVPIDRGSGMWLNINSDGQPSSNKPDGEIFIGSCTFNAETSNQQKIQVTKCRLLGTHLVGSLYAQLVYDFDDPADSQYARDTLKYLCDMFIHYIKTKSANQRLFSGWTLESWAQQQSELFSFDHLKLQTILPQSLKDQLNIAVQETSLCYDELAASFTKLQHDARDFVATAVNFGLQLELTVPTNKKAMYNFTQIQYMCDFDFDSDESTRKKSNAISSNSKAKTTTITGEKHALLETKRMNLSKTLKLTTLSQKTLSTSVLSSLSCAHISWRLMPKKLKLVIDPLLDSIEIEEEQSLQDKSIKYLVTLFDILCQEASKYQDLINSSTTRLVDLLSLKAITSLTDYELSNATAHLEKDKDPSHQAQRIVLLDNLQRKSEYNRAQSRRQSSVVSVSNLKRSHSLASSQSLDFDADSTCVSDDAFRQDQVQLEQKLRGSSTALRKIVAHFGDKLPEKLPKFWNFITDGLKSMIQEQHCKSNSQDSMIDTDLLKALSVLEVVGPSIDERLRPILLESMSDSIQLLSCTNPILRHYSAQCAGIVCRLSFDEGMRLIDKNLLPMLNQSDIMSRCGAIEALALIIEQNQLKLVSKIDTLVIHILRRMSDQNDQIRMLATHCFGKLLSLMPLNLNKSDIKSSNKAEAGENGDQRFIEQLLNSKNLDDYELPFKVEAELRSYQKDGINWLAFLNRFNLHGILCDEMGLGKTLMTICTVASDFMEIVRRHEQDEKVKILPSLIVCPPTLTEHWLYETAKFLPDDIRSKLNPIAYSGLLGNRASVRRRINGTMDQEQTDDHAEKPVYLVVASYDIVRNDIDFFKSVHWNYCVLDEGHMIKNGRTKLSRAIRLLIAEHRLILSGTPIQNNVTELWSLFDYLMPGFLGSERQFNSRYAKPILQSREPKCSSRDLEAGALAMESLHRQVLPFILRRLKEDVLTDLPPKIIQDYYCEMSPLQLKLYEDFSRAKLYKDVTKRSLENLVDTQENKAAVSSTQIKANSKSHVFQALQYLKNVCNHPKLVLAENHSQYREIKKSLDEEKTTLDEISHSSKLKALKQLLLDCGIGIATTQTGDEQLQVLELQSVVNQHRALIFCQLRSMVNIIESDLLKKHLPSVTYLKLDGSIPTNQRQSIVERFNNDPSIDVLLLTTQIGGLGLNLTGADTVIFVEHDWNPTKDLQAMDRAHRIGQNKVVNVYRLITKGTLEEKIMGLQKFKTMVSNTVINQDNTGLTTMNVDQLFDLFDNNLSGSGEDGRAAAAEDGARRVGISRATFMDLLPELWDQQQYETEYDLSSFVSSLKR